MVRQHQKGGHDPKSSAHRLCMSPGQTSPRAQPQVTGDSQCPPARPVWAALRQGLAPAHHPKVVHQEAAALLAAPKRFPLLSGLERPGLFIQFPQSNR